MADLRRGLVPLLAAAAAALPGCSAGATGPAPRAGLPSAVSTSRSPAPAVTSPSAHRSPSPRPTQRASVPPDIASARPELDPTTRPAPTSGTLRRRSLPAPAALGPGWAYRVDPGSAEEGYLTSGEPATARAPREVVAGLAPYACPDLTSPPQLPVPRHALEVTYVHRPDGAPGVGLALDLASAAQAATFLRRYTQAQADCSSGRARVPSGTAVSVLARDADGAVVRRRDPADSGGVVWVEAVGSAGPRVLLTALADTAGTDVDPQRLARALRGSLRGGR